ncbi:hypothetical protein NE237_032222 [Protea cynaroides]|uniref:WAT1-related protein n=1 Tax=Protea cynaroides TaxID=273540 RepID=A0A9Q0R2W1_9MAGN|nr:hypothetical protein NE237_032222 [Protea cynaroides]
MAERTNLMSERPKQHLVMLAMQFIYASSHVVSGVALTMGISKIVFLVYNNIIALLLVVPLAYFLEKDRRPELTARFFVDCFLYAVVEITATQGFYLLGLDNTSPTFASAIQNSVPAITFLMNDIFSQEDVLSRKRARIAKWVGALSCVVGVLVITVYKSPIIFGPPASHLQETHLFLILGDANNGKNWTLGCIYLIAHCFFSSAWKVWQASVPENDSERHSPLSITSYTRFFGVLQFLVIAAFIEKNSQAWLVHWGTEFFSVLYTGIVVLGIDFAVKIWCIGKDVPLVEAMYQPVQTLVVALFMASNALGEQFYLGGMIGAALNITGLYLVLWAKNEDGLFENRVRRVRQVRE